MSIWAWCDGSGTHDSQGPACIGVIIFEDDHEVVEASEHVGSGTNNYAELRAMRRAFRLLEDVYGRDVEATIVSDSEYAIGSATAAWSSVHIYERLVEELRKQRNAMPNVRIIHVDGHKGIYGNEVADWLAGRARVAHFKRLGIEKKLRKRPVRGTTVNIEAPGTERVWKRGKQ